MRPLRQFGALVPLTILLVTVVGGGTQAHGDVSSVLQVFDAESAASPIGVISKVPAETDGGVVFAQTHVELGKSIATAAGATLGPLGDAFLVTSIPGYVNPVFVTAQYPPSKVFPTSAKTTTSVNTGPLTAISFQAAADASPAATADAVGGAGGMAGLLQVGGASSHSSTHVTSDGTVTTTAVSTLSNVTVGPVHVPLLSISTMTSTASVTIPLSGTPTKSLNVTISGALLGGVPIQITQSGINVGGTLPVPANGVATIDAALAQLSKSGITLQLVPVVQQSSPGQASVSGAALEIGYAVPAAILGQLPTDIGTNETVLLGEVTADATARPRVPISLPPLDTGSPSAVASSPSPSFVGGGPSPAPAPSTVGSPAPTPSVTAPSTPLTSASQFSLPRRTTNAAAKEFLLDYRIFIVVAIVGLITLFVRRQTRLVD